MDKITVIKIGGSTFGSGDTTVEDIISVQKQGKSLVVVHGGGNMITDWLKKQGVATKFVGGERVTDEASLEVVIAVLAGLANKQIVAAVNRGGGRAVGISGVDGALVKSKIKDKEMGLVGVVTGVDPAPLETLLKAGYIPVVSPVSLNEPGAPGAHILNINGDQVAGEIAVALQAKKLVFLTDVAGILDKSGTLLPRISVAEAEALIAAGVASGGMIPKIKACIKAAGSGAWARIIDGRKPHALLEELDGRGAGTVITK